MDLNDEQLEKINENSQLSKAIAPDYAVWEAGYTDQHVYADESFLLYITSNGGLRILMRQSDRALFDQILMVARTLAKKGTVKAERPRRGAAWSIEFIVK